MSWVPGLALIFKTELVGLHPNFCRRVVGSLFVACVTTCVVSCWCITVDIEGTSELYFGLESCSLVL